MLLKIDICWPKLESTHRKIIAVSIFSIKSRLKSKWTMLMFCMFHPINYKPFYFTLLWTISQSIQYSDLRSLQSDFNTTVKLMEANCCLEAAGRRKLI